MAKKTLAKHVLFDLDGWREASPNASFRGEVLQSHNDFHQLIMRLSVDVARKSLTYYEHKKGEVLKAYPDLDHFSTYDPDTAEEQELRLSDMLIPMLTLRLQRDHELLEPEPDTGMPQEFTHSPDYRSVAIRGKTFTLTPQQAQMIEILHRAHLSGMPDVGIDYILTELGNPHRSDKSRWQDTWKSKPEARKALIKKGEGKGMLRLNL